MTTRGVTGIVIALEEEVMVGVGLVLTEGHQVQCIAGAQVLTMVVLAALFMIGTVALHMTGTGVLIMVGTGVLNMADIGGTHTFNVPHVGHTFCEILHYKNLCL
jgi:hypothetical protein